MDGMFTEMNQDELMQIDGGIVVLGVTITAALVAKVAVGAAVVGAAAALGFYNGYNDTMDQKK